MRLRFPPPSARRRAACLAAVVALAGCAHRPPTSSDEPVYPLPRISDDEPAEPRLAHVVLRPQGNVVRFLNAPLSEGGEWVVLARVEVLRRDTEAGALRPVGTVEFAPAADIRSMEAAYADTSRSALTNRYEFRAYTTAGSLVPLPVLYSTTDRAYATAVEGPQLGRQNPPL